MNNYSSVDGSLSLTEALQQLAWELSHDARLSTDVRAAAKNLSKCLEVMEKVDSLIAVQTCGD